MRKNPYFINIILIATVGLTCLIRMLAETFMPGIVLPRISIPFLVILSLIPLVLEYYLVEEVKREWVFSTILAGLTFLILPLCSGWNIHGQVWQLFAVGTVTFGVIDLFYRSIGKRISSGPCGKLSPVANGALLYLASQCMQGLL